ncbi:MAG: Mu transposase C-terminal domain-containing protein [Methylocystis sp.]|jgi:putative transposase
MGGEDDFPDDEEASRRREEGCRREEAIRDLLKRHDDKRLSIGAVDEVAQELGVSRSTMYRLITAYRAKGTVSSVEPRALGRRRDTLVLDDKREKLIAATIREIYMKPERPTMTYLIEQVRARCAQKGLPLPDRRTIKARVDRIDRRTVALKRKDLRGAKATKAVLGQYVASRPLEVVQIDHTEVDVFLVDEKTRETTKKRPWLTLAIDVFTRMVVGFHLSMDKPSRVSLGLCMLNAVYDKSAWLKEREIDASWPAAGLPEAVHADNGADFRSRAFAWACREEGIKLIFRPPGAPHYGGHIERLIGTMMGRVHFYPGSTFANPIARQGNKPGRFAAMTFREFECALGWEIAGRYNEEIHSALLRPPIAVWREHEASLALRMPKDRMAFWVSFLPDAHRTLRPDGIWLHDIPYWSNALSGLVGRAKDELLVKFDPRDVSRIFVQHPDGRFLEARARPLGFPVISLREWKQGRKALGGKGRRERNDEQITKTALTQRKLIDEAIAKTAAARRAPIKTKNGDGVDFGSMSGIDSRIPTVLELVERQRDRNTRPSDG